MSKPVNPNASKEVKAVLDYLESIRGNGIITGQHTLTMEQEELNYIEKETGKLPALFRQMPTFLYFQIRFQAFRQEERGL